MNRQFGIIGGDRRQAELVRMLEARGDRVSAFGLRPWGVPDAPLTQAARAPVVLLPMPLCRADGLLNCKETDLPAAEVLALTEPGQMLFAGKVLPQQRELAERRQLTLLDYLEREELAVANAVPTAEGAIQIALEQLPVTLCGTKAMVIGFGRIGKLLTRDLRGLGAKVTVAARKESDRVWARSLGCAALDVEDFPGNLDEFRVIFNTVPAVLLHRQELSELRRDCIYIELASQPGLERQAAEELELAVIPAGGLPGKVAPETAAQAILDTVDHMILEWRNQT